MALVLPELFDMLNAPDALVIPFEVVMVAIAALLRECEACLRKMLQAGLLAVTDSRPVMASGGRGLWQHLHRQICAAFRLLGRHRACCVEALFRSVFFCA